VQDLDRQVLAKLAENLFPLLLEDLAGAVVWIDNLVANLVADCDASRQSRPFLVLDDRRRRDDYTSFFGFRTSEDETVPKWRRLRL
jgi:hypothetical protein